jgi:hypothetical protein
MNDIDAPTPGPTTSRTLGDPLVTALANAVRALQAAPRLSPDAARPDEQLEVAA